MDIRCYRPSLTNCQFTITTDNSDVGRVKISRQNFVALAAQPVSILEKNI